MPTPTPAEVIAKRIVAEQDRHVKALSGRLKSEMQTEGAKHLTREEMLALAHRNWQNATFRQGMLKQLGNKDFLALHEDMVKAHGDPMVMRGGMVPPSGIGPANGVFAAGGLPAPGAGSNYGPPAAPVNGVPLPPYLPAPPTKWGG